MLTEESGRYANVQSSVTYAIMHVSDFQPPHGSGCLSPRGHVSGIILCLWRNLKVKIFSYINNPFTSRSSGGKFASEFVTCPTSLLDFIAQILRVSNFIHCLTFPPSLAPIFPQTLAVFPQGDRPCSAGTLHNGTTIVQQVFTVDGCR